MKTLISLFLLIMYLYSCNELNNRQHALSLLKEGERLESLNLGDSAFKAYQKSIKILERTNEYELLGEAHLKVGRLLTQHTLNEEALCEYKKVRQYGEKLEDKTLLSKSMRYIGQHFLLKDSTDYGIKCVKDPLNYINQIKDPEEIAFIYNNLSFIYYEQKQYREALVYNDLSLSYCTDTILKYKNYSVRGNIYFRIGMKDSARYYFQRGLKSPNLYTQASIHYHLYEMDSLKRHYNKYIVLRDSIDSLKETEDIAKIQLSNNLKPKAPLIKVTHLIIFGLCLSVLVWYSLYRKKQLIIQKQNLLSEEKAKKKEDRIDAFKKSHIYKKIKTLVAEESKHPRNKENIQIRFSHEERKDLFNLLEETYPEFISALQEYSDPQLNQIEIMYCCLTHQLKLSNFCTAICLNVSSGTPRQYKKRICEKLQKSVLGKKLLEEMGF